MELKNFYVVVTEENNEVLSKWRFGHDRLKLSNNEIVGIVLYKFETNNHKYVKGHNARHQIKDETYDFGEEITFEQFKKYILKEETESSNILTQCL